MRGKTIQSLLDKRMTRAEFLRYLGGMLLGVFGAFNLITHMLGQAQTAKKPAAADELYGFGEGKFGV
jgi:hypothetical protein